MHYLPFFAVRCRLVAEGCSAGLARGRRGLVTDEVLAFGAEEEHCFLLGAAEDGLILGLQTVAT